MNCPVCGDKGLVRVCYHDGSPDEFGVCLCAAGQSRRSLRNGLKAIQVPAWQVWAAQERIALERIAPLEDLVEPSALASIPRGESRQKSAIAEAMQTRRPRL